jgi:hypothetical protein
MKKVTLIAAVAIAVLSTSCKKDRTCTCTSTNSGVTTTDVTVMHKVSKKNATANCIGYQRTTTESGAVSGSTVGADNVCTLK